MRKIEKFSVNRIIEHYSLQSEPVLSGELTGYPSIDRPWMKNYPEGLFSAQKKFTRIFDKLMDVWSNPDEIMINYYDNEISAGQFYNRVYDVAKSLTALGVKKGDSILTSLESVPEYLEILLASEIIGCSVKNYLGDTEHIINILRKNNSIKYYFAPTYLSQEASDQIYGKTQIENIITIDPLHSVTDKSKLRDNIVCEINARYVGQRTNDVRNITWSDFLERGKLIESIQENHQNNIDLFSAFTSGTTGEPKEVRHSSETVLGIINQLTLFPFQKGQRDRWLLTIVPPSLVAVVIAMTLYPLIDGKTMILDPYCKMEDLDLEMMHYRPECWGVVPAFFDVLIESERIPEDYDMSYFKLFGFGAEPLTKGCVQRILRFFKQHNCKAPFSSGYGQSEGGSDFTVAIGSEMLLSGAAGIPLINTVISIFEPNTTKELKYYEVGEICKSGPGIMLGYSDQKLTEKVLKVHEDGQTWLHTGDLGFMTEKGLLFVLGRDSIKISSQIEVFPLEIENKVSMISGVKEAIIVSGKNEHDANYEVPYLFVVPEKGVSIDKLTIELNNLIEKELKPEERPKELILLDKKPIKGFKTDRMLLKKKF